MAGYSRELFPDLEKSKKGKRRFPREFRLVREKYIKLNEEKVALIVLFFLGVGVGSYILGYKIGIEKSSHRSLKVSFPQEEQFPSSPQNDNTTGVSSSQQELQGRYLIQLVAYKNPAYARREKNKLEKKGYNVLVKKYGKWSIVYAGYYNSKKDAENVLKELKRDYRDAFIKKIKEEKNE